MSRIRFEDTTPINKSNLDKLNNVVISGAEPTTGEEVWIQKSNNIFTDKLVYNVQNGTYSGGVFTQSSDDTSSVHDFKIQAYDLSWNFIGELCSKKRITEPQRISFTFEVTSNMRIIQFGLNGSQRDSLMEVDATKLTPGMTTLSFNVTNLTQGQVSWDKIQIEFSTTATDYEPYVEKKIYTKNDNGVYEEFYKEIESGSDDNGSYIKYADGTLIQYGKIDKTNFLNTGSSLLTTVQGLNFYRSSAPNTTLPQQFKDDTYFLTAQVKNGSSGARTAWIRTHDKEKTYFSLQLIGLEDFISSANGYTNLEYVDWLAIGKWK